jgi:hypothetical protein
MISKKVIEKLRVINADMKEVQAVLTDSQEHRLARLRLTAARGALGDIARLVLAAENAHILLHSVERLLGTCELNLDDMEPETRDAVREASLFLADLVESPAQEVTR